MIISLDAEVADKRLIFGRSLKLVQAHVPRGEESEQVDGGDDSEQG
jgi:hypothetical protein